MRTPPPIPISVIDDALRAAHTLKDPVFTFVRGGEDSWGFNVASPSGAYRLKIFSSARDLDARLEASYRLHHTHGISEVVCPIPTRGARFTFEIAGKQAALFPYILGTPGSLHPPSEENLRELGQTLAAVHQTNPAELHVPIERFDTDVSDAAQRVLDALPDALAYGNPYSRALAQVLMPIRDILQGEIERLKSVTQRCKELQPHMVLCHGDPTLDNILVGTDRVFLIDWDNMRIAPREFDLMHFSLDSPVIHGYTHDDKGFSLDQQTLSYYHALWNNEELAGYGGRILFEDLTNVQSEHDLAQIQHFLQYSGLGSESN